MAPLQNIKAADLPASVVLNVPGAISGQALTIAELSRQMSLAFYSLDEPSGSLGDWIKELSDWEQVELLELLFITSQLHESDPGPTGKKTMFYLAGAVDARCINEAELLLRYILVFHAHAERISRSIPGLSFASSRVLVSQALVISSTVLGRIIPSILTEGTGTMTHPTSLERQHWETYAAALLKSYTCGECTLDLSDEALNERAEAKAQAEGKAA